jgi:hypothetical protein
MDSSGLIIGVVQAKLNALEVMKRTGDVPQNVNFALSLEVLADFLDKNDVRYEKSVRSQAVSTARVAEVAQGFTYRVECQGTVQHANVARTPVANVATKQSGWFALKSGCLVWNVFPVPDESASWSGPCRDGVAEGSGVLRWFVNGTASGEVYDGDMKNGKPEGGGVQTYKNGATFTGTFKDGRPDGSGTHRSVGGDRYVGEVKDGRRHGLGSEFSPNGSLLRSGKYEQGTFVSGK